ncbi:MAG TPA: glycosyl hydrolase family 32, partial [Chloroflexota bacterium]|nr:glycosyl hydrolase family 32 [Chloroflexota bacterium]
DYGEARVEVLGEDGSTLDGFSSDDCAPLRVNTVDARVAWKGGRALQSLTGRPVRLRFRLKNARLYSYRCT